LLVLPLTELLSILRSFLYRGHTWKDLDDSLRHMSWPWNIFTCLHIWRPESHGWGYDLITSAAMRIANNQLGCEPEDLDKFLQVLDRVGAPEWLDGTIDTDDDEAWQIYIRETLANYWNFLVRVNKAILGGYFGLVLIATIVQVAQGRSAIQTLWGGTKGVLVTHILVVFLAFNILHFFRRTPWAEDVLSGRMLMRPFPPVQTTLFNDPSVSKGPTTFPDRRDVLFGGRLDARTIGAYNRWLEFHPGNKEFLKGVSAMGGASLYRSYVRDLPPVFQQAVEDATMEPILSKGGRFLQQDYRTGDWLSMRAEETHSKIQQALYVGVEGPLYELRKELDFVIGDARFGFSRETAMAKKSLVFLNDLDRKLLGRFADNAIASSSRQDKAATNVMTTSWFKLEQVQPLVESLSTSRDWISRWTAKPLKIYGFIIGEELMYKYTKVNGLKLRAKTTLMKIHGNGGLLDLAFYGDNVYKHGVVKTVSRFSVEKVPHLYEGSPVWANQDDQGEWFPGTISLIGPDGDAEIQFADGDYEAEVPRDRYNPRFE
jgi:fumarate reductase subunit C